MDSLDIAAQVGEKYARKLSKTARTLGSPVRISFEELAATAQRELKRDNIGVIRVGNQYEVDESVKRIFVRALLNAAPEVELYVPELDRPKPSLARVEKVGQAVDALRIQEEEAVAEQQRRHTLTWLSQRRARHAAQGAELQAAPTAPTPAVAHPDTLQLSDTTDLSELRGGDSISKTQTLTAPVAQTTLRFAQGL